MSQPQHISELLAAAVRSMMPHRTWHYANEAEAIAQIMDVAERAQRETEVSAAPAVRIITHSAEKLSPVKRARRGRPAYPIIATERDGSEIFFPSIHHAALGCEVSKDTIMRYADTGAAYFGRAWRRATPDEISAHKPACALTHAETEKR